MTQRRSKGDGGLHWDASRQRWMATISLGFDEDGKRVRKRASGRTKTEARAKLKELLRQHEENKTAPAPPPDYTVEEAVLNWLTYGLAGKAPSTVRNYEILCRTHVIPALGKRKLPSLTADHVDRWLAGKAKTLSTRTLQAIHSCLSRSVQRAILREKVHRNVVALCEVPTGRPGRPSKALTFAQAEAVLGALEGDPMHAYVVVSLLTGARTEELRPLTWDHVDIKGRPEAKPPVPPHIAVWRSVRDGGDTKTRKSRRTLALPERAVAALRVQRRRQQRQREAAGDDWKENGLVFTSEVGTPMDAANVRRAFRRALGKAEGIDPEEWIPRELRHSFVSLLSDHDVPVEEIAKLVGHSATATTEKVYRKQIRPVIQTGAKAMDRIFGG
ncbi:site-specific integrase [Streptomyces sp. 8K308]|uniref:tyrosine-type recombinase/integrase n=1 Tax=Streptomyces sp. 8K308 TaxID=2530388 RepID=UPI001044AD58|nr:tyrosine-type recombinase/integrase [Streptomyces sp. 8K308]TDC25398.1 site-specific integrase [Streptomyces sp. 8K308]